MLGDISSLDRDLPWLYAAIKPVHIYIRLYYANKKFIILTESFSTNNKETPP